MENQINYYRIDRAEWRNFYKDHIVPLTNEELDRIKSLNDRISMEDVSEVYMPMVHLLQMFMKNHQRLQDDQASFLGIKPHKVPFILGIAGSVAVGKSTTARLLKSLLSEVYPDKKVQLITTDGFIFPNAVLKKKGIMSRKGFPESYDMPRLIKFVNDVKNGIVAKAPVYSHKVYDIIPDEFDVIDQPDILIVEGINVLQLPSHEPIFVSDFSIFRFTLMPRKSTSSVGILNVSGCCSILRSKIRRITIIHTQSAIAPLHLKWRQRFGRTSITRTCTSTSYRREIALT